MNNQKPKLTEEMAKHFCCKICPKNELCGYLEDVNDIYSDANCEPMVFIANEIEKAKRDAVVEFDREVIGKIDTKDGNNDEYSFYVVDTDLRKIMFEKFGIKQ